MAVTHGPEPEPDAFIVACVAVNPPDGLRSLTFNYHPQDVALPVRVAARAGVLVWLAGAPAVTRGSASIEEHWSPTLETAAILLVTDR